MAKEGKRKLHTGRVIATAVIFILIIVIIIFIVKILSNGTNSTSNSKKDDSYVQLVSTQETTQATTTAPANYSYQSMPKTDIYKGELILVNNDTKFQGEEGAGLVKIYDIKTDLYMVKDTEVQANSVVCEHLNTMLGDFATNSGLTNVMMISGYRSTQRQAELYQADLDSTGLDYSTLVTKSGYSEHHTGLALDFGLYSTDWSSEYDGTGDYAWINENCYKYGFVVRYPSDKTDITKIDYEPWHFRYVGQPHAYAITQKGLCFEEYIEYLKQFTFDSQHLIVNNFDGNRYEIYYVPATEDTVQVPVPTDCEYTISGNNVDGFIITENRGTSDPTVTDNLGATTAPPMSVISGDTTTTAETNGEIDNNVTIEPQQDNTTDEYGTDVQETTIQ